MSFFDLFKNNNQTKNINKCTRFINAEKRILHYGKDVYMQLHTSKLCDTCNKYDRKIYSVSKSNNKYPYIYNELPTDMYMGKCPKCGKCIGYDVFIHGINSK